MIINEYHKYTPATLAHTLGECATDDTASVLSAAIVLAGMVDDLTRTVNDLTKRLSAVENDMGDPPIALQVRMRGKS